jgi:hypothetical protein
MRVWVLFDGNDYYGPYFESVHASFESADRRRRERQIERYGLSERGREAASDTDHLDLFWPIEEEEVAV